MVLAVPALLETDLVGPLGKLQVALETEGWVLIQRMKRRQENPKPERSSTHYNLV
jgi:hypothetical protein